MEAEAAVIVDTLDPVDAKYRLASDASSRRATAVVPVLVVCASCVRTSAGSCRRKSLGLSIRHKEEHIFRR